jgi:hypothetical protein
MVAEKAWYLVWTKPTDIRNCQERLFQNFSFWNSFLRFRGNPGLLLVFPRACFKTNRVLGQAQDKENRTAMAQKAKEIPDTHV